MFIVAISCLSAILIAIIVCLTMVQVRKDSLDSYIPTPRDCLAERIREIEFMEDIEVAEKVRLVQLVILKNNDRGPAKII